MSRVGKHAIPVPEGVTIQLTSDVIEVSGKLGKIKNTLHELVNVQHVDGKITVNPVNDTTASLSLWGTFQRNIKNAVKGVSEGFVYDLDLVGVGYRASVQGQNLVLQLGFSHDIVYPLPQGVTAKCEKPTAISLMGPSKQQLGQIASELQSHRKPEPYKGKGVLKKGQFVLRKEGKKK